MYIYASLYEYIYVYVYVCQCVNVYACEHTHICLYIKRLTGYIIASSVTKVHAEITAYSAVITVITVVIMIALG